MQVLFPQEGDGHPCLQCTSSGTHLQKLSILFALPAGSLKNFHLHPTQPFDVKAFLQAVGWVLISVREDGFGFNAAAG